MAHGLRRFSAERRPSAIGSIRAALPAMAPTRSRAGTADPSTVAQPLAQLTTLIKASVGDMKGSKYFFGGLK
jgi:hypothetical protein